MVWTMEIDPLHNIFLSALVAALPIMYLFWALACRRMKGHLAALWATTLALCIATVCRFVTPSWQRHWMQGFAS